MITKELRVRLGAAIEEYVTSRLELYENCFSGVNDVKNFYYFVADVLQGQGVPDDEILALYRVHRGNYLLVKKNGVSASEFARRLLEGLNENNSR